MKLKLLLALGLLWLTGWTFAKPEILADFGGRPTEFPQLDQIRETLTAKQTALGKMPVHAMPSIYPVTSKLTVGVVEPYMHQKNVDRPIFIVGVDELSVQWLFKNRAYLASIKATGIVTNVESELMLIRLKSHVPELGLVAIPVEEIAAVFNVSNYPVLIDHEGVRQ